MADRVLVEVLRNLTDMNRGDRAWVADTPLVRGMVDGGNWKIVDREVKSRKVKDDGPDSNQPE